LIWDFRRIGENIDFIIANTDQVLSKFNDPNYTMEALRDDSMEWHEALANKKGGPGGPGRTILKVGNYKWVSLDRRYCEIEKRAGRHCGNIAGGPDDNILSLRDSKEKVKLTFIVNKGKLIEAKASGNERPQAKYHPAIAELLKSEHIKEIYVGGRFLPEKDFHFSDLSPELRNSVLAIKPNIDDDEKRIRNKFRKKFKTGSSHESVGEMHVRGMSEEDDLVKALPYSPQSVTYLLPMLSYFWKEGKWMTTKPEGVVPANEFYTARANLFHSKLRKTAPWIWEDW